MLSNYNFCIKEVLKSEGGYTNDPLDRGGPTNFGITIWDYRAYINKQGTAEDVRRMTVDQAKAIYKSKYWDAVGGDNLPSGLDYTVFDFGVNSGVSRALRYYKTYKTINAINAARLRFLQSLPTWNHFGAGWGARVARVKRDSNKLAGIKCTTPTKSSPPPQKPWWRIFWPR